ncbi:hypothetical protein [Sphingomonas sp. PB4P5]|uniref:hypothetical protein n=1 Tax=Parasphingomonas puruogangriensis TaxID=3096155 RepID=UPI002FC85820
MADTIVRVVDGDTVVVIAGAEFLAPYIGSAATSAAAAEAARVAVQPIIDNLADPDSSLEAIAGSLDEIGAAVDALPALAAIPGQVLAAQNAQVGAEAAQAATAALLASTVPTRQFASFPNAASLASLGASSATVIILADETRDGLSQEYYWDGKVLSYVQPRPFSLALPFVGGFDGALYLVELGKVWINTAGTTPAAVAGDQIARIDDQSGNGRHLLQATSALQPILRLNAALAKPYYAEFSATQWMASAATYTYAIAGGSYIAWAGSTSSSVAGSLFGVGASGTDFHKLSTLTTSPFVQAAARKVSGSTVVQQGTAGLAYAPNALAVIGSQEQAGKTDLVLGKGLVTATNLHTTESVGTAAIVLGALNGAAGQPVPQNFYGGIVVKRIMPAAFRQRIQDALATRIGLTLPVPVFPVVTAPAATVIATPESTISPTPAGKGMQAIGMTHFAADPTNTLWLTNFGAQGPGTTAAAVPTLVKYDYGSNAILREHALLPIYAGSNIIQGATAKDFDKSLFIAYPNAGRVEHCSIGAEYTGAIAGNTMTVSAVAEGKLRVGDPVIGAAGGTTITGMGSTTSGYAGTYTVSTAQTLASTALVSPPRNLGPGFDFEGVNGIAYDNTRYEFWLGRADVSGKIYRVNEAGVIRKQVQIKGWPTNYEMDQMWHDAAIDRLYVTAQFAQATKVLIVNPETGDLYDFVNLPGLVEGEGPYMLGNILLMLSDGYFHTISGANVNRLFAYDMTGLL